MALIIGPHDVLLVIDVQRDFCAGGALGVPRGDEVVPVVNALARRFAHVVLTQDWHPPGHVSFASSHRGKSPHDIIEAPYGAQVLWPDHCVPGTVGAELHPDLDTTRAEAVVRKGYHPAIDSYSAFYENDRKTPTGLVGYLKDRGLSRVFLAGLAADFCVQWTGLDGRREGFDMVVVEDATRAIDLEGSAEEARRNLREAGVAFCRSKDLTDGSR